MSRPLRLFAATTVAALAAAGLVGVPTEAAVATRTVTFQDCDLTIDDIATGNPVPFTTSLTLDYPTPIASGSTQTVSVTLGTLPAGTFPEDLPAESFVSVTTSFEDQNFSVTDVYAQRTVASFDVDSPYVLGEFEEDRTIFGSGLYDFRPKSIRIDLFGDPDGGFAYSTYSLRCDQVVDPASLLTVAVFDPAADATLVLDGFEARQGAVIGIGGRDFAHEPVEDPDGDVTVTVGGIVAGTYDVDQTGAFSGVLRVPEFVKPGSSVQVRATSQGESATSTLTVSAKKGTVKVSPGKAKAGKKVTVTASGFKPGEQVRIQLKGGRGKGTTSYATKAAVGGSGVATKTVRLKKAAKGSWRAKVTGPQSFRTGAKGFKVT